MKRSYLIIMLLLPVILKAQTPTLSQKLYLTGKVWGFVKYNHSNVSTCNVNWDSVLISVLPAIRYAATDSEFNDALDTMLAAAGPMALATSSFPDVLPAELKRNRDFSWITSPVLRTDVQVQLDTIKNNFRPHASCWVDYNSYTGTYFGFLVFPYDSLELNASTTVAYPDSNQRLLMLYKYWNIIRYFNPNNHILDTNWDTTLMNNVLPMAYAPNAQALFMQYLKIATTLNDAHSYGLTWSSTVQFPPGFYKPYIRLQYFGGQYVVVKSLVSGITPGDAITSVDGLTMSQWEDSLRPYYSSGNLSVFRRSMCENVLGRMVNSINETIVFQDSAGTSHTITTPTVWWPANKAFFYDYYYPADSLNSINWKTMECGVGYLNIGNLSLAGTDSAYAALRNAPAIIVDIRNYPVSGSVWQLADLMYPHRTEFAKFTIPDVTFPGTLFWETDSMGHDGNTTPYIGKVIVLMNEETQSAAEFDCMVLSAMPGAVKIGSQTAGADGNVTFWKLAQDLNTGFTTLGVYYPNGDSTQRIGIVPDSVVYPTRAGIRHHDDEVLNKALGIACSVSNVPAIQPGTLTFEILPNPAHDKVTITSSEKITSIVISNLLGQTVGTKTTNQARVELDIEDLPDGVYFIRINNAAVRKFIKN